MKDGDYDAAILELHEQITQNDAEGRVDAKIYVKLTRCYKEVGDQAKMLDAAKVVRDSKVADVSVDTLVDDLITNGVALVEEGRAEACSNAWLLKLSSGIESLRVSRELCLQSDERQASIKAKLRKAAKIAYLKQHKIDKEQFKEISVDAKKKFSTLDNLQISQKLSKMGRLDSKKISK